MIPPARVSVCLACKNFEKGELSAGYFLFFFFTFCRLFFSISAASDHYLIGNNITVAVLGIVIPIGE